MGETSSRRFLRHVSFFVLSLTNGMPHLFFLRRQWKGHGGKANGGKGHGKNAKGGNSSQNSWQASTPLAFAHALRIFAFRAFAGPQ